MLALSSSQFDPKATSALDQVGRCRAVASLTPRSQGTADARIEGERVVAASLQPFNVPWLGSADTPGGLRCRSSRAPRASRTQHARQQAAPAPWRRPRSISVLGPPSAPQTTRSTIGVALSPHLFRTAIASSAAIHGGANRHLASALLHHTDSGVTEAHYNRASSLSAAKSFREIIQEYVKD
jgi:hypothetical protein